MVLFARLCVRRVWMAPWGSWVELPMSPFLRSVGEVRRSFVVRASIGNHDNGERQCAS
jgi:hypothetical protein